MTIYKTTRWKNKRLSILKRDEYLCQHCKRFGRRVDADTVHHIYTEEQYPQYSYCDWNLTSLCNKCHNTMHDRDSHELTSEGKKIMQRTIPPGQQQNN